MPAFFAGVLSNPGILFAQGERATVTGAVTDPSGQMLVGADVAIRNTGTNIFTRTKTNQAGIYYLPALSPGTYELRVEYGGFRPSVISSIPLAVGLTATLNVSLEIGSVSEAVQVTATAVQLESQTTSLGKVMQTKQIAELPILGRSVLQLLSTIPGIQPPAGQTGSAGGETHEVKMSGGMQTQNGVLTDGGESRAPVYTESSFTLPIESVAEFRVDTATYPAEYGRAAGGVVNLVTKSGTNQFHGVLYEFLRNNHLNANSWQNNRTGVKRNLFQRNEYGLAVGGPLVRDRTFFFLIYDAQRQGTPIDFVSTVPTAAQRQGDFSQTFDSAGRPVTIYDPRTTRPDPNNPGKYVRDPFPQNRIPVERINSISNNVLNFWPAPNRTGEGPTLFNNYFRTGKRVSDTYTWVGRLDHLVTEKHRTFGRVMWADSQASTRGLGEENAAFPAQSVSDNPRRSGLISLTSTFTPSILGELRVSYTRFGYSDSWDREGFDLASLGFPQSLARDVQYKTFPTISVSQYTVGTGLSVTGGSSAEVGDLAGGGKNYTPQDTYQLQYHLTYLRNRHKFKMGADLQSLRLSTFNTIAPASRYFFDRIYTQGPDPSQRSSTSGSALPAPTGSSRVREPQLRTRSTHIWPILRLLLPGRRTDHEQADREPRTAVGVHHTMGREVGPRRVFRFQRH
ncbi:MAG: carboxypeptidase regulatory-like domain-containing protein [Bryobacteraceae bacterium]